MTAGERNAFVLLGFAGAAAVAAASGPPLVSAYYFEDQSVTIEGDVVEFEYRAPHAWVRVNVLDRRAACVPTAPSGPTLHG